MSDADKLSYLDQLPSRRRPDKRAVLAAAVLALVLGVFGVASLFRNPVVGRTTVLGLCLEVKAEKVAVSKEGLALARVVVATPDSTDVQLLLPPPVPRPGDFLPLIAERYKKGNVAYDVDAARWIAEGPQ